MGYVVASFDGLELPEYLLAGDVQDASGGEAILALSQLPGGAQFDNWGERDAPLGVSVITKRCLLWADNSTDLYTAYAALQAKKGKRGRLTVIWDDGQTYWQWARLIGVNGPRRSSDKGPWLSVELDWMPLAGDWFREKAGWRWGDLTWTWGDGSASFDALYPDYELETDPQTVTITNKGDRYVRGLRIEIKANSSCSSPAIWNKTTGQLLESSTVFTGIDTLIIDIGARSVQLHLKSTTFTLASVYGIGAQLYVQTTGAHGLSVGDKVCVDGTTNYDGVYEIDEANDSVSFYVKADPELITGTEETTGSLWKVTDEYTNLEKYDKKNWMWLAPGANDLEFSWGAFATPVTVYLRWYNTYG